MGPRHTHTVSSDHGAASHPHCVFRPRGRVTPTLCLQTMGLRNTHTVSSDHGAASHPHCVFRPWGCVTPTLCLQTMGPHHTHTVSLDHGATSHPHCVFSSVPSPSGVQGNSKTTVLIVITTRHLFVFPEALIPLVYIPQKGKHMVDNFNMKTYLSRRQLKMMAPFYHWLITSSHITVITDLSLIHNLSQTYHSYITYHRLITHT